MEQFRFRAWYPDEDRMEYQDNKTPDWVGDILTNSYYKPMQYTGLKDKNGKEIYEGDIIQYHETYRSTQTHYGDNIPNGAYTEPMEPEIRTVVSEVVFRDGAFIIDTERVKSWGDGYEDIVFPLAWCINNPDEESIKSSIEYRKYDADMWDDPEEGDLQYLLETYNLPDLQALIDHCTGIEIIGNIYQNPDLI